VACLPGLEPLLSQELHGIKMPNTQTPGGVIIRDASTEQILKCHLYLGCASHVYLRCGKPFDVRGFPEIIRKVSRFPWEQYISANVTEFDFRVKSTKSKLIHTGAISERVQQGILKRLGRPSDFVPNGDTEKVAILVRIHRDTVTVSLDTSNTPLHRRGYRLETAKAPLREDIAFAMLYAAGLRPEYHLDEKNDGFTGLLDPFCGSGTIPIEGAAMMAGLAPGRLREAPLKGTLLYNPKEWGKLVAESFDRSKRLMKKLDPLPRTSASDRDEGAVESTKRNAQRAGVLDYIDIQNLVLANNPWIVDPKEAPMDLLVATNPPFGRRVSTSKSGKEFKTRDHLLPLYQSIGHQIKTKLAAPGRHLSAVILNHHVDMVRRTGLPSLHASFTTDHGGLAVAAMLSPVILAPNEHKESGSGAPDTPEVTGKEIQSQDTQPKLQEKI
jgi:putative N6-adenine-specific DNA methylase